MVIETTAHHRGPIPVDLLFCGRGDGSGPPAPLRGHLFGRPDRRLFRDFRVLHAQIVRVQCGGCVGAGLVLSVIATITAWLAVRYDIGYKG